MRAVHELEYMQDDGIPALAVASVDGDWQVRMAAVHALGPLGRDATPILKYLMRHEPCPVVRLIILNNLGSQAPEGAEAQAIDWMLSASNAEVNNCSDQARPGRAAWAAPLVGSVAKRPMVTAPAPPPRRPAPPAPRPEPEESHESVVTADVAVKPVEPVAPKAESAPDSPTKNARYMELDSLLADRGPKESLDPAQKIGRRPDASPAVNIAPSAPQRPDARAEMPRRETGKAESLPKPVVPTPSFERPTEAEAKFEAADGRAPHDAVPDLIRSLKSADARTRARAADELGNRGAAAVSAVPALIAVLKDASPRVRASASLALGNIGSVDDGTVPLLVKALKDKNLDVRYAATLALSRIPTPAARRAFRKYVGEDGRREIDRR